MRPVCQRDAVGGGRYWAPAASSRRREASARRRTARDAKVRSAEEGGNTGQQPLVSQTIPIAAPAALQSSLDTGATGPPAPRSRSRTCAQASRGVECQPPPRVHHVRARDEVLHRAARGATAGWPASAKRSRLYPERPHSADVG